MTTQERIRARNTRAAVAITERAMQVVQVDACLMPVVAPNKYAVIFRYCAPSDHGYQYNMGIGDAWSIKRQCVSPCGVGFVPGTLYHYGFGAAHYPVPALALEVWRLPHRVVIVQEHDCGEFWQETYSFPARD